MICGGNIFFSGYATGIHGHGMNDHEQLYRPTLCRDGPTILIKLGLPMHISILDQVDQNQYQVKHNNFISIVFIQAQACAEYRRARAGADQLNPLTSSNKCQKRIFGFHAHNTKRIQSYMQSVKYLQNAPVVYWKEFLQVALQSAQYGGNTHFVGIGSKCQNRLTALYLRERRRARIPSRPIWENRYSSLNSRWILILFVLLDISRYRAQNLVVFSPNFEFY